MPSFMCWFYDLGGSNSVFGDDNQDINSLGNHVFCLIVLFPGIAISRLDNDLSTKFFGTGLKVSRSFCYRSTRNESIERPILILLVSVSADLDFFWLLQPINKNKIEQKKTEKFNISSHPFLLWSAEIIMILKWLYQIELTVTTQFFLGFQLV